MRADLSVPIHRAFNDLPLIDYLALLWPDRSRRTIAQVLERGDVRSGERALSGDERVGDLDALVLRRPIEDTPSMLIEAGSENDDASGEIDILHEDARLVVLGKPAGVPVVPDRDRAIASCLELVIRRELAARRDKPPERFVRPRIVHRIDRLTSGLVIVALTPEVERRLGDDFEHRRIEKEYLAIVEGVVEPARVTIDCPIGPGRKGRMRAEAATGGKPGKTARDAVTVFEVVERFERATLVRALPLTGRTHQIRVHAWAIGHPLAVDPLYRVGPMARAPTSVRGIERLTLHAHRYTLPPHWDEPRHFTCPLPDDFTRALQHLRGGMKGDASGDAGGEFR